MKKIVILLILQFFLLQGVFAQSGTSWYSQDFTALIGQVLTNYQDGRAVWDTTESENSTYNWYIVNGTYNGDDGTSNTDYFRIDPDPNTDNEQNAKIMARVDLPKEADVTGVPVGFYLVFDWWSDQGNLGGGTDPDLDPDASITVELRFHDGASWGSWTEVWSEDDQSLLEETTISGPYGGFDWDRYNDYAEGWYTTELDFSSMVDEDDSVAVRFTYSGINADEFFMDNFDIRYMALDDWEQEVRVEPNYRRIPRLMAEDMNMEFKATITKNTTANFDDSENDEIKLYIDGSYSAYADMLESDFTTENTVTYTFDNLIIDFPLENDNAYRYQVRNEIPGSWSSLEYIDIDADEYQRDNNTASGDYLSGDVSSPGVGVLYHFINAEHWDGISVNFNTSGYDFNYDLLKVSGPDATSGDLVYSSGNFTTAANVTDNFAMDEQMLLEAGYYIVMVNQLTTNDIEIDQDDQNFGFYYRGDESSLTKVENTGFPHIRMRIQPNRTPSFVSVDAEHTISVGQQFSYTVEVEDADFDDIGYRRIDPTQQWLVADWLTITANPDTTFTLSGAPDEAASFTFDMRIGDLEGDSTTQTFTIDVIDPYMTNFVEDFDVNTSPYTDNEGWNTIDDAQGTGSSTHWNYTYEFDGWADDEFKGDSYVAEMFGEAGVAQEEWLVSPAIQLPDLSASTDSVIHLEFAWRMNWKYFVGPALGNENDGYDVGDVTVYITTDGGSSWTQVWKEDDSTSVLSTTVNDDNGTTADDEFYDDTPLDPDDWPGYKEGIYEYSQYKYFLSRINMNSYAGQTVWVAFKYESTNSQKSQNADFWLDYVDVKAIEPGVKLEAIPINTTAYTKIPLSQLQPITVQADVANLKLKDITGGTVTATYVDPNSQTVYNESSSFSVDGEDTTSVVYGTTFTPMTTGYYDFTVDAEFIDDDNTTYTANKTESNIFEITSATNGEYAKDNSSYSSRIFPETGDYLGMKFDIHENDNLRQIKLYINGYTWGTDEISFTLVKDGDVVVNSRTYTAGTDFGSNWQTFDINDIKLTPGTYYLMVKIEENNNSLGIGYDTDNEGYYYEGTPGNIMMNPASAEDDTPGNLMLRMVLGNDAPEFSPAITAQSATVGLDFSYNISAIDDNQDSLTFILEQAPSWVSLENKDDGNRAVVSGTPGTNDEGSNLVRVAVFDATDTTRSSFTINVAESPNPEFKTTPVVVAEEGLAYQYVAVGYDRYGDDVTLSMAQTPSWLSSSVSASGDTLTLSGTPAEGDVGEHHVKINVTDEYGKTAQQAFTILVKVNIAPEFLTYPTKDAVEGVSYSYTVRTKDENKNDILALSVTAPAWLSITDNGDGTGVLSGTPATGDVGENDVTVTVTDNKGASTDQEFTIDVEATNNAPAFTTTPDSDPVEVQAGTLFEYIAMVSDADGDPISFTSSVPVWILVTNEGKGEAKLIGQPMLGELGDHSVVITATDGEATVSQSFTVTVIDTTSAPVIEQTELADAYIDENYSTSIKASDEDGDDLKFEVVEIPVWLTLTDNANGTAKLSGTPAGIDEGDHEIQFAVSDNLHKESFTLTVNVIGAALNVGGFGREDLTIYPNPASDYLILENAANARVAIFNVIGAKVLEKDNLARVEQLDVSSLLPGKYIIKVVSEENTYTRSLLIK